MLPPKTTGQQDKWMRVPRDREEWLNQWEAYAQQQAENDDDDDLNATLSLIKIG